MKTSDNSCACCNFSNKYRIFLSGTVDVPFCLESFNNVATKDRSILGPRFVPFSRMLDIFVSVGGLD
jgi:hypothetical protein